MRLPYLAGNIAFNENFYGRRLLLDQLLDPRHTCVHLVGRRRMGKTSVLHRLRVEVDDNTVALFVNLQGTGDQLSELGVELVEQIEEAQPRFPVLERVKREPVSDPCAIIRSLAAVARRNSLSVLMLWDEGEQLLKADGELLSCLRAALQDKPQLRTILAATQRLRRLIVTHSGHTSPFLHGFAPVYLPPLDHMEAIELINQAHNLEGPVKVTPTQTSHIVDVTGGQPYLMQVVCSRLFDGNDQLRPLTAEDLIVDETLDGYLQNDYEGFLPDERAILTTLAAQPATVDDLARSLHMARGNLEPFLYEMMQTGLLSRCQDQYQVANFFLQNWLVTGRMREPDSSRPRAPIDVVAVTAQLANARANLDLIDERVSEFVQSVEVPLQLIKDQRRWRDLIASLEQRLAMG